MQLYVSGVEVPKLNSPKDIVLREFLVKEANREIHRNKVMAYNALAVANLSKNGTELVKEISKSWNDYVNVALFMEEVNAQVEMDMQQEYAFWKNVAPKINIGKNGKITVSGLPTDY